MNSSKAYARRPGRRSTRFICLLSFFLFVGAAIAASISAWAQETGGYLQSSPIASVLTPAPSAYGTPVAPGASSDNMGANSQLLSATLLGEPFYGTAPLTGDFYVGLTSPQPSMVYQWQFGDGAVSSQPPNAYMHVYEKSGTYQCWLTLINAQGRSTALSTTIVVLPPQAGPSSLG
jgi:PKD repeat protein